MAGLNYQLVLVTYQFCYFSCITADLTFENLDLTNARIQFDPFVSILDQYNNSRYSIDDLIPFVSTVSTKFSKCYVELQVKDIVNETSLQMLLMAIAKYNCLPDTPNKIDILLAISRSNCYCEKLRNLRSAMVALADAINQECNNTINTIAVHHDLLEDCKATKNQCKKIHFNKVHADENTLLNHVEDFLRNNLTKCKSFIANSFQHSQIIKKFSVSDTDNQNVINMTNFVLTWTTLFSKLNSSYIISKAFDTPYFHQSNGWWFLENDSDNPSDYIFKEKLVVHQEIGYKEDPRNFEWLRVNKRFDKNVTGIIYTGNVDEKVLANDFCRILAVEGQVYGSNLFKYIPVSELSTKCGNSWQVLLASSFYEKRNINNSYRALTKNTVVLVSVNEEQGRFKINKKIRDSLTETKTKFGYFLSTDVCVRPMPFNNDRTTTISNIFGDAGSVMYVFHFTEPFQSVKQGATRLFRQRVVVLNECRKFLNKHRNQNMTIVFAILNYFVGSKFYKTPASWQKYVKYINLLSNWVETQKNVQIFIGPDSDNIKKSKSESFYSIGWYSYDEVDQKFITKREEALKISNLHYADSKASFGTSQILIIIAGSFVLFISSILLAAYITRRYYRKKWLSEVEIDEFFNGSDALNETDAYKAPYDKEKHEISADKFSLNENELLGSGEFGKVCKGTICVDETEMQVAIKALNPLKFHKTTLHGMLSEIKVLAYLGKHQNIIELLGAHTAGLRMGKVFLFLELCHFGSLEKRLQEIRASMNNSLTTLPTNANLTFVRQLDESTSNDFYRWSAEICNGMVYLAKKHVLHRDLATRNILLNSQNEVKICDFGLSRRMYNYINYVKTGQEPLPWKWMAPESLLSMEFSEKSDVWAYGITLWEIYSLGISPYPGLSWEGNFAKKLQSGLRLQEPEYNEKDMYVLMTICWNTQPNDRPNFSQLLCKLKICENCENNSYATVLES